MTDTKQQSLFVESPQNPLREHFTALMTHEEVALLIQPCGCETRGALKPIQKMILRTSDFHDQLSLTEQERQFECESCDSMDECAVACLHCTKFVCRRCASNGLTRTAILDIENTALNKIERSYYFLKELITE